MKKIFVMFIAVMLVGSVLAGCSSADHVNHNLTRQADEFKIYRKVVAYNARTDTLIFECEGYISISNNSHDELIITAKTGADEFKKAYVYLTDNILYTVQDTESTSVDPYHYEFFYHLHEGIRVNIVP